MPIINKATTGGTRQFGDTANPHYWQKTMGNTTSPAYRSAITTKFNATFTGTGYNLASEQNSYFGTIWDRLADQNF